MDNAKISAPAPGQPEPVLPRLRQDLTISQGGPDEDGGPTWLMYDPLKHSYFRIGQIAFTMLSSWQDNAPAGAWLQSLRQNDPSIETEDLAQLMYFLTAQGLTVTSTPEDQKRLEMQSKRLRPTWYKWLLTHYLYIRIPCIHPDRFLTVTLPAIAPLFHPMVRRIILTLGLLGILLVIRQWDVFTASILHFFNLRGAILFGITLFFVKGLHELGHAYTAKRQGCRIPTMGVAFLVLYPFLYTDTTDAWRLVSKKQRLAIVTAGVKTELALALVATFAWSFLDEGVLKSMAFFVATTSWVASLSINMSPFMRFDGYYALSDWLGAENLQQRAFALARWRLRETLFKLGVPPPEALSEKRRKIFLLYAYATWVYRFTLFLGIALLVYHMVFKALGIILFCVEITYFLLLPMINELKIWWKNRRNISLNLHSAATLAGLLLTGFFLFAPWQNHVLLPAVLETDLKTDVFPRENARITSIHVKEGQEVTRGEILFVLASPELEKKSSMLKRRSTYIQTRIDRHIGSASDLDQLDILQGELAKATTNLEGVLRLVNQGTVCAPQDGYISTMIHGHEGQWVSRQTLLARIVGKQQTHITAYVQEDQLHRIQKGATAFFYGNSGDSTRIPAQVLKVDATAVSVLTHPETASSYGGPIAVRQLENNRLRPERGVYKVVLEAASSHDTFPWRIVGKVYIKAPPQSLASHFWQYAASVFIRESGL
ncbi:MAG: HlyD family efflux transporter periplasmic adaptor subunit [Desulfoplanes sp.]|nr:HlyD family efflux transporter periplasmic adaptor subunit [Desulfoplanes sp.]